MLTPVSVPDVNIVMRKGFGKTSVECILIDINGGRVCDYVPAEVPTWINGMILRDEVT